MDDDHDMKVIRLRLEERDRRRRQRIAEPPVWPFVIAVAIVIAVLASRLLSQ